MRVSKVKLWNFRKFGSSSPLDLKKPNLELPFDSNLSVLIGENDSGKSAIIDSLRLVLRTHSYDWFRLAENDFFGDQTRLRIEVIIDDLSKSEAKNFIEWLAWTTTDGKNQPFLRLILDAQRDPITGSVQPYEVRAGKTTEGRALKTEAKDFLKITYLRPLRDAGEELIARRNSRLSQILLAHDAFKESSSDHVLIELLKSFNAEIENYFSGQDKDGIPILDQKGKALKDKIDHYISLFYKSHGKSSLTVTEQGQIKNLLEKLELSILDEIRPGLGTLNRLFIASELLHLNKDNWNGIRLGLIEEVEAHLHPQAQMQAIQNFQADTHDVQLILTTHSPNIGSKLNLQELIICTEDSAFPMGAKHSELAGDDYVFLERFLDVTKANLFFSKGLILVEGWSEEIIVPELAKSLGFDLTRLGVSIINVGSLAFMRYANIFKRKHQPHFNKKISIVTDVDLKPEDFHVMPGDEYNLHMEKKRKAEYYDGQSIKSFIAPMWTLEYCLSKSTIFRPILKDALASHIHTGTDWSELDRQLYAKLVNKSLNKTALAHHIAENLSRKVIAKSDLERDPTIDYLVEAIKYACED
jgi:putative ATP-dependent endonuclease of OLD family